MNLSDIFVINEKMVPLPSEASASSHLYHLTNYKGLTNAIKNDALVSYRQGYISTTWDVTMNAVVGRDHYHFKFQFNKERIFANYEPFGYVHSARVSDGSMMPFNEREVGLETQSIAPLSDFAEALILLISPFSRSFVQWMFYRNYNTEGVGIQAMYRWMHEWGKPVRVQPLESKSPRELTEKERHAIEYMISLRDENLTYVDALERIVDRFNILDHEGYAMTTERVRRERSTHKVTSIINDTLAGKPIKEISESDVAQMVKKCLAVLGYGSNYSSEIFHLLVRHDLIDPMVEPYQWGSIFRSLIVGDDKNVADNILLTQRDLAARKSIPPSRLNRYAEPRSHLGTRLSGIGDGH